MSSTRLTKAMREDIRDRLISSTFSERAKVLKQARIKLADEVYKVVVPADFLKVVKKNPVEWFVRHASIAVSRKGGGKIVFALNGRNGNSCMELSGAMAFPASVGRYSNPDFELSDETLLAKIEKQTADEVSLVAERDKLKSRVSGLLASVTTVERLREAAPELVDYLPEPEQKSAMPVVQVGALVNDLKAAGLKIPKAG